MRRPFLSFAAVLVTLVLGACAPASTPPPDTTADMNAIAKLRADFATTFNAGDLTKLLTLYTADAVVMGENEAPSVGHDAILARNQKILSAFAANLTLTSEETKITGDWAFDRGQFTFALTPKSAGMAPMTEHGKYVVILQKQSDASWKVAREIGNSSDPMMMPPPAPAAMKK